MSTAQATARPWYLDTHIAYPPEGAAFTKLEAMGAGGLLLATFHNRDAAALALRAVNTFDQARATIRAKLVCPAGCGHVWCDSARAVLAAMEEA